MNCLKIQTNEIKWYIYIYCRFLDATTNKQNNTSTEKNAVKDADEHLTTTEKVTHNQTADEKEYTFVGLIVLVLLVMILLLGALIYIRKTGKICYKERFLLREGILIKYLTFLTPFLILPFSLVFRLIKKVLRLILKQKFNEFCQCIIVMLTFNKTNSL